MKIRIIARGIHGANGPIPIGTELTMHQEPVWWGRHRYEVITPEASPKAVPVQNVAPDIEALQEVARGDGRRADTRDARSKLEEIGESW